MSEVGTSLHLWRAPAADVRGFVSALGVACRIVASNSHWTCVVPFDREDEPKLLSAWTGRAIYWSYSEDYGLGLDFYESGQFVAQASFVWGTALTGEPPGGNFPAELRRKLFGDEALPESGAAELERVLADLEAGLISGSVVRDRVAHIFELAAFEWLSPELCLQMGLEDVRQEYPDAEDIGM